MGGIAAIAKAAGHRVTGCDSNAYPPMSTQLVAEGVALTAGFGADQASLKPDLWVVGNVVTRGNPLMEAILDRGDPYISGPQWLAENVLRGKRVLAVSGTHGKTTTSSMLMWILEDVGMEPGFLIGGIPKNLGISAKLGKQTDFVIEADEYDTAFFDKRSKMIHYHPKIAVVNNIEFDHADIFRDLAAIETQFHHFVRTIPSSGKLVVNGTDSAVERVLTRGCWTEVERFGTAAGWSALAAGHGSFEVLNKGETIGLLRWELHGDHNQQNALAAIAAAQAAGVDPERAILALSRFKGVRRRMEFRGTSAGVSIWDDFAHHPTAIAATLSGMRDQVGDARILAVLEPRSNTMKAGVMKESLPASLEHADHVFCYSADLGWDPHVALAPLGARASIEGNMERLIGAIVNEVRPGDHVLVMSNGGFGGIHERLLAELSKRKAPTARA